MIDANDLGFEYGASGETFPRVSMESPVIPGVSNRTLTAEQWQTIQLKHGWHLALQEDEQDHVNDEMWERAMMEKDEHARAAETAEMERRATRSALGNTLKKTEPAWPDEMHIAQKEHRAKRRQKNLHHKARGRE